MSSTRWSNIKSPTKPNPVLFVGDALYGAIAAVRALSVAGYVPYLAVDTPGGYASRSRAVAGTVQVPDPASNSEGFVRELATVAARLSVSAVLPGGELYLLALADREADFEGIALGTPPRASIEWATDKVLLAEFAATAGLQTPPTAKIVQGDSAAASTFGFPVVVKPRQSWIQNPNGTLSRYSAYDAYDAAQVAALLEALPGKEGLVQPNIPGQLCAVAGVSWKGDLVCALHQASIRIWPLRAGVSSYAETIPPNAELEEAVGRLLQAIGWSGLFQAQFIRNPSGEYYLIDLNPRVYGSLALAGAAGLNLPGIWADLLLGRQPAVGSYRVGVRYRHEEYDARVLVQMMREGDGWRALRGLVPRRNTTHAIFSLHDPMPSLVSLTRLAKRLQR